jgi:FkbM family methyltransferase
MFWCALKHNENGFYMDIGSQDPLIDSVSLAFHEHGWRGIHVEPTPHYTELLRLQRSDDTVIQAAVSTNSAFLLFLKFPIADSTADSILAKQHRERRFEVYENTASCITLSAIFSSCVEPEIHLLKINIDGLEQQE